MPTVFLEARFLLSPSVHIALRKMQTSICALPSALALLRVMWRTFWMRWLTCAWPSKFLRGVVQFKSTQRRFRSDSLPPSNVIRRFSASIRLPVRKCIEWMHTSGRRCCPWW